MEESSCRATVSSSASASDIGSSLESSSSSSLSQSFSSPSAFDGLSVPSVSDAGALRNCGGNCRSGPSRYTLQTCGMIRSYSYDATCTACACEKCRCARCCALGSIASSSVSPVATTHSAPSVGFFWVPPATRTFWEKFIVMIPLICLLFTDNFQLCSYWIDFTCVLFSSTCSY